MKNCIKKISAAFLVICLMIAASVPCISINIEMRYPTYVASGSASVVDLDEITDLTALRSDAAAQLAQLKESIDISAYKIPVSMDDALTNFFWRDVPGAFHVLGVGFSTNGTYITKAYFTYTCTQSEYDQMSVLLSSAAASLINGIAGNDALNDVQKALLIHDRLCVICEYDYNFERASYNAYGALVNRKATCDGYSRAYSYLLYLCGIKSYTCVSDALNHGWNLVQIDGVFYHVDVTWDDTAWKSGGSGKPAGMDHNYFLLSNEGIYESGHNANDYYTPDNDDRYEGAFWQDSNTQFCLVNGEIYWFDNNNGKLKTYGGSVISEVTDTWYTSEPGYYWIGNYVSMCAADDSIFYTTSDKLFEYDTEFGKTTEWNVDFTKQKSGEAFYGISYSDHVLTIYINTCPVGSDTDLRLITVGLPDEPTRISASLSSTGDLAGYQTVHVSIETNGTVKGYYWGKNEQYDKNAFITTPFCEIEFPVSEEGSYYFTAVSEDGSVSNTCPIVFCRILLHTDGGTVSCDDILTYKGNTVVLPTPEKANADFNGWATDAGADSGSMTVVLTDPPLFSEYYATWKDRLIAVSGTVTTVGGIAATVTVSDGSDVIYTADTAGDYSFEADPSLGYVYVTISAPGHATIEYRVDISGGSVPHTKMFLTGDVNGDDSVNNKDVIALFRSVTDGSDPVNPGAANVNADGGVNNKDVILLFKYVSDPSSVTLSSPLIRMY